TKGLPGVAESTASKSEGKLSPWGEGPRVRTSEGWQKRNLPSPSLPFHDPHPRSATVASVPKGKGYYQE
ncbi:MAG: hypothetical protein ACO3NG_02500, partial [bacterium]